MKRCHELVAEDFDDNTIVIYIRREKKLYATGMEFDIKELDRSIKKLNMLANSVQLTLVHKIAGRPLDDTCNG